MESALTRFVVIDVVAIIHEGELVVWTDSTIIENILPTLCCDTLTIDGQHKSLLFIAMLSYVGINAGIVYKVHYLVVLHAIYHSVNM